MLSVKYIIIIRLRFYDSSDNPVYLDEEEGKSIRGFSLVLI